MAQITESREQLRSYYALSDGATPTMSTVVSFVALLVAGTVSWLVVRPGESLFIPLLVDVVIFALIGVAQKSARPWHRYHLGRGLRAWFVVSLCAVSLAWTYFGVLAASVTFDAGAATLAQHEIALARDGCHVVEHGSVGFINAPYQVCTTVVSDAATVDFSADPWRVGGYSYITGQSVGSWFPDGCARHLYGHWWAYAVVSGTSCPLGYGMQPGP